MKAVSVITFAAVMALTAGAVTAPPVFAASTAKPVAAKAATGALPRDAHGIPTVALPYTFVCTHCGLKVTIKTQADWTKSCPMCPCGVPAYKCLPHGK